ncbi:MAG: Stk1 family PASTA domain-containing Ser/Thr kinase [Lachnospiraceae bacterium]|nr:Stk1 family PASTA domain-containing Ser/Thr kinase [Lachnospiraceae bacterium]
MLEQGNYVADRYEILDKIGTGGMSDVYKAKDHILGREVAIKVLKQEFAEDINFVTKFRTEAQSAAGLEHPNIVNIYDVGSDDGSYFIVMEYVEGITLKTYIEKKGQLNFKEAISIAIQVGRGIEAAHNKGIIHRDIKPQNIIISTEGKVKVTDFGIARATSSNTIHSDVMGSVHYVSPEQARNGFVDFKSDIYSLGIVMYEMVTGRVPFDGDSTVNIALKHLQDDIVTPSAYAPDLPISIEKIILKATLKSPDRRYASMEDLLLDLKKALVSPNEDFVNIVDAEDAEKTKILSAEEQQKIKDELLNEESDEDDDLDEEQEDDEDEDEGPVNPKMDKAITIMIFAAAAIIIVLVVYFVGSFFGIFGAGTDKKDAQENVESYEMISVVGKTEDEAKSALKKAEIPSDVYEFTYESSDTVEEGKVISQSVKAGEMASSNNKAIIKVSTGESDEPVEIPNVTGMTEGSAKSAIEGAGFKFSKSYEYSADTPEGQVISYSPSGSASKGDTITVVISAGIQSVQVPSITGMTESEANNALSSSGLKVGNVTRTYSDNVSAGRVISQGVASGKTVDASTSVDFVVSDGPKPVYYSGSFTASCPADAVAAITVTISDANGTQIDTATLNPGDSRTISVNHVATSSIKVQYSDGRAETYSLSRE